MATVQRQMAEFEGGVATIYLEYEDTTMRFSGIRCVNNGQNAVWAGLIRANDRLMYEATFPANLETYIPIPTNGANRVDVIDLGHGKFGNIEFKTRYPA